VPISQENDLPLFMTLALIMLSPTAPGQIDRDPAAGI